MRLNDLAKKLNITCKELQEFLNANGANVKGHMSNVDKEHVASAEEHFSGSKDRE